MATEETISQFKRDGFAVIENFVSEDDVNALKTECYDLIEDMNPAEHNTVFKSHSSDFRTDYFLNSVDKVRYFFEDGALDEEGHLKVDKQKSLNKIGHALHIECQNFRRVTFGDKVQEVCRLLGYDDPRIIQSMYIFKQPGIGGVVFPHQDASYLYTEPMEKVFGLWIALEDADIENSCLWFVPGSQKVGHIENWRMVREGGADGKDRAVYIGGSTDDEGKPKAPTYDGYGEFVPVPVKKGSAVLIDGLVIHKSEPNTSQRSRHIYTFHIYDKQGGVWSDRNWAQPNENYQFASVFRDGAKA